MFRIATVILLAITTTCMAQTITQTPTQAIPTQNFQQYPSYQQPTPAFTTPSHQQPVIQNPTYNQPTYNQPINNSVVQQPYTQQFNSQQFSNGQAIQQQPVVTQPQSQTYTNTYNQPYSTSTPTPSGHVVINGTGGGCNNSGASSINSYSTPQYQRSYSSGTYRTQPTYNRSYYQPRTNFRRWFGR